MHKYSMLLGTVVVLLTQVAGHAQEPSPASGDAKIIHQRLDEYCRAFNEGDIDTLMAFWADEADYVEEDGQAHRGKQAIGQLFRTTGEQLKGYKLQLEIESLRLIRPDVAIEDGVATLTDAEGEANSERYTAVWVKNGDQWLIQSVRDLASQSEEPVATNADYLEPLAWLIGDWVSEDDGPQVKLQCRWALDKNFISQNYTVAGPDGSRFEVIQWVGFDPVTGQIKSWTFDSLGGYGEALWTRDGNTWQAETSGVLPGGNYGSSLNSVRYVDDTHMEWSSTARNIEGQAMPDAKVKFVRGDGDR